MINSRRPYIKNLLFGALSALFVFPLFSQEYVNSNPCEKLPISVQQADLENKEFFLSTGYNCLQTEALLADRFLIENFFRELIIHSSGGYVLFGNKPLALEAFYYGHDHEELLEISSRVRNSLKINRLIKRGWETWEKYAHLFPDDKFILKAKRDGNWVEIHLINKLLFLKTINDHLPDFQKVLGSSVDGQQILNRYLNEEGTLYQVLKKHDGLYGTLLGYGRENAWLFHQRKRTYDYQGFTLSINPRPDKPFWSVQEEREFYVKKLQPFPGIKKDKELGFLSLPQFLADPESSETQSLYQKYFKDRQAILEVYSKGNFLTVTLEKAYYF